MQIIVLGIDTKDIVDKHSIAKLVKAALPHRVAYIDKFGDAGYHNLLEELEKELLVRCKRCFWVWKPIKPA
jgi:hypothetical protein